MSDPVLKIEHLSTWYTARSVWGTVRAKCAGRF